MGQPLYCIYENDKYPDDDKRYEKLASVSWNKLIIDQGSEIECLKPRRSVLRTVPPSYKREKL
jgi:hypothetical protein